MTSNVERLPYLHLNARSRNITTEEIHEVYWEEITAKVSVDSGG